MTIPEELRRPSIFVAGSLVAACALALATAIAGYSIINGATTAALTGSHSTNINVTSAQTPTASR